MIWILLALAVLTLIVFWHSTSYWVSDRVAIVTLGVVALGLFGIVAWMHLH